MGLLLLGACASGRAAPGIGDELRAHDAGLAPAERARKWEALARSPHAFLRGTPWRFWARYGQDPRLARFGGPRLRSWSVGDLHAENTGFYAAGSGRVVFGLNDFDEAVVDDVQLDLWRLGASLLLAAEEQGVPDEEARAALRSLVDRYLTELEAIRGGAAGTPTLDATTAPAPVGRTLEKLARKRSRPALLDKWAPRGAEGRRLAAAELAPLEPEQRSALAEAWPGYLASRPWPSLSDEELGLCDAARRLGAGTSSIGRERLYALTRGPAEQPDQARLLELKEQVAPAGPAPAGLSPAARAVLAQRLLAPGSDPALGHLTWAGRELSVRERSPWKEDAPLELLAEAGGRAALCEAWARVLAGAHAAADADGDPARVQVQVEQALPAAVGERRDEFLALVAEVAEEAAAQARADHGELRRWLAAEAAR